MASTYTQIHIQVVFAVQDRISLVKPSWELELYKYITGIVQNNDHKLLAINVVPDHLHFLIGMRPIKALSNLIQDVKRDSSIWINEKQFAKGKFSWQEGYGAFSYSRSHISNVIHYIEDQKLHHKKITFVEECKQILEKFQIPYDPK